jgi:peptidoglycan hydrolase CwlO-like protein
MELLLSILAALLIIVVAVLISLIFKQQRSYKHLEQKVSDAYKKIEVIQHDVSALCSSGLGVDERVDGTERRVRSLIGRLEDLEDNDAFEHLQEFQNAIELAQKGAAPSEIVEKCHLTVDEAELLIRLHKA